MRRYDLTVTRVQAWDLYSACTSRQHGLLSWIRQRWGETQLTPELMSEGAVLIAKLDALGVSPDAALWIYSPDIGGWRLLLAERRLASAGPRKIYREIQKALTALRSQIVHLSLEDVSVTQPGAPIVRLLRQAIATVPGIGGIRFSRGAINGTIIEDAYIYRLKRPAA